MSSPAAVPRPSVAEAIGDRPLSALQRWTILLCGIVVVLDGFDTQCMGFLVPVIAEDLSMPLPAFVMVRPLMFVVMKWAALGPAMWKTLLWPRPSMVRTLAPGPWMVTPLVMASCPPVSAMVPCRPGAKVMGALTPGSCAMYRASRKDRWPADAPGRRCSGSGSA